MFIKLLNKKIEIVENIIGSTFLWLCTILIFVAVLNRYFFHFEIMGIGDLAQYVFVFLSLTTIAIATREKAHTSLDMFHTIILKNNPKKQHFYSIILKIIVLILIGTFLPLSYKFMSTALKYPEYGTIIRWFNTSWLRITVFIMGILIFYHLLYQLIDEIKIHR